MEQQTMVCIVAIDTETTGLVKPRPIELGMLVVHQPASEFCERIRTDVPIEPGATAVHGMTSADLEHARDEGSVLRDALAWLETVRGDAPQLLLVAHNAAYDRGVLEDALQRHGLALPQGVAWECTLAMSRARRDLPPSARHTLHACCVREGIPYLHAHSALGDARMCAAVYCALRAAAEEDEERAAALAQVAAEEEAELADALASAAAAEGGGAP